MKHRLFFAASLCCLLLFGGFNAAAQDTAPLPPPGQDGSGPLPDPSAQAPAQSGGTARGSGTAGSASRSSGSQAAPARSAPARSTPARSAPARSAPAQEAPARSTRSRSTPAQAEPAQAQAEPAQPAEASSTQEGIPSKGLFWGAMFGGGFSDLDHDGSRGSYVYNDDLDGHGHFNLGLLFGYDFGLLAFQTGLSFASVSADYKYDYYYSSSGGGGPTYTSRKEENIELSGMTLRIPVMLKLDFHVWRLMLQPQGGIYFNFGLGDMDYEGYYYSSSTGSSTTSSSSGGSYEYDTPLFGVMAGVAMGVRIGRGYLFMDFFYAMDLGETKIEARSKDIEYTQHSFTWSLGYQYYFK